MAWSGGNFTRIYGNNGWTNDATLGVGIEAGRHDIQDNDLKDGIDQCLNKTGQNSMTGDLNLGGYRPTNVAAGTAAAPALCVANDVNTGIFQAAAAPDTLSIATNSTERVRVDSSGRVGIGTTSPGFLLDAQLTSANAAAFQRFAATGDGPFVTLIKSRGATVGTNTIVQPGDTLGTIAFGGTNGTSYNDAAYIRGTVDNTPGASNDMPGRLEFHTTPDGSGLPLERMRIDSTGNVGIGVASPLARTHISGQVANAIGTGVDQGQLFLSDSDLNTSGLCLGYYYQGGVDEYARIQSRSASGFTNLVLQGGNGAVVINKTSTSTSIAGTHFTNGASSTSPSTMFMVKTFSGTANGIANYHSGTYVGGVDFSNTATAFPTSSDYRLKENVVKLQNALSRVNQLKPSRFNFISEPDETIDGFLAHEVANVVPNAVFGEKDAVHDDGSIKVQSLDNSKIVPLLTAAIQELNAKVEALEAKVQALEAVTEV